MGVPAIEFPSETIRLITVSFNYVHPCDELLVWWMENRCCCKTCI